MSNSLRLHGLQPARLLCPWDSPGKNTGVGCHFLLQQVIIIISNAHMKFAQIRYAGSHYIPPTTHKGKLFEVMDTLISLNVVITMQYVYQSIMLHTSHTYNSFSVYNISVKLKMLAIIPLSFII